MHPCVYVSKHPSNLKHQCWLRNFIIDPRNVVSDYEVAVIEAFKQMFPGIKARGCFFHFNQCFWKQIKQVLRNFKFYQTFKPRPSQNTNTFFSKIIKNIFKN
jgi:hypothetical protein